MNSIPILVIVNSAILFTMKKYVFIFILVCIPSGVFAATTPPLPTISAKGVAIYGWKDGVEEPTPIYVKNEHRLYPVASITKLITAKAVQELYPKDQIFTMSPSAIATEGSIKGMVVGSQFTRDDLLKALLIMSSNDAATAFMEAVGKSTFLAKMNDILHTNKYTATSFLNPSGLDPAKRVIGQSNRLTPYHLSELLSDIYTQDPLLVDIMNEPKADITDLAHDTTVEVRQSNGLYLDDKYKDKVLMGKTGLTALAGQNLAFVTPGNQDYDYITIVILGSKNRMNDSKKILDWIDTSNKLASSTFGG